MSALRSAVAVAVVFACWTKSPIWRRRAASGVSTRSDSEASCESVWFWLARIARTRSVSRREGLARWIAWLSSAPRPARAGPNSLMRIAKRWGEGDLRAGVFHLPARHCVRRVAEEGATAIPAGAAAGAQQHEEQHHRADRADECAREPSHGAGDAEGSQVVWGSLYGAEWSGVGCIAPPGQRLPLPVWRADRRLLSGCGVSTFDANENSLKIGSIRA